MRPSQLLVPLSLLSAAFAAPSGTGFSIETEQNIGGKNVSFADLYMHDLKRLRSRYTSAGKKSKRGTQSTTVSVSPVGLDLLFYGTVYIGGQAIRVQFDTGSSDDWVIGPTLTASQKAGRDVYTPNPLTARLIPGIWSASYGDGSQASGVLYTDSFRIGSITLPSATVEVATTVVGNIGNPPFSGILGLAYPGLNQAKPRQTNWVFQAKPNFLQPVFCSSYRRQATGTWDFGFIDNLKHSDTIVYTPISPTGFWQFNTGRARVGQMPPFGSDTPRPAIVDSGSNLLTTYPAIAAGYYAKVPMAIQIPLGGPRDTWFYPCSQTLPDLQIQIGTIWITVKGSQIAGFPNPTDPNELCPGLLQEIPETDRNQVFGGPVYKSLYIVHDMGNNRVGFANKTIIP